MKYLIATIATIATLSGCATPFKIIDDKTYQIELTHPNERVIIKTPNGGEQVIGYIEVQE